MLRRRLWLLLDGLLGLRSCGLRLEHADLRDADKLGPGNGRAFKVRDTGLRVSAEPCHTRNAAEPQAAVDSAGRDDATAFQHNTSTACAGEHDVSEPADCGSAATGRR